MTHADPSTAAIAPPAGGRAGGDASNTPDSSVVVAAFSSWHESHESALSALAGVQDVIAHVELEAYSVLTRLPPPFRVDSAVVVEYMREEYRGKRLTLGQAEHRSLLARLAGLGIMGGAVYDALIAATAIDHRRCLISCDRRAAPTYERLGVEVTYL